MNCIYPSLGLDTRKRYFVLCKRRIKAQTSLHICAKYLVKSFFSGFDQLRTLERGTYCYPDIGVARYLMSNWCADRNQICITIGHDESLIKF